MPRGSRRPAGRGPPGPCELSQKGVDAMLDFFSSTWTMVGMGVVLVALIGLLIFLRTRPQE